MIVDIINKNDFQIRLLESQCEVEQERYDIEFNLPRELTVAGIVSEIKNKSVRIVNSFFL